MLVVDTRGMSCPQPVLMTKKALAAQPSELAVLVDTQVAKANVQRFLNSKSYSCEVQTEGDDFRIQVRK